MIPALYKIFTSKKKESYVQGEDLLLKGILDGSWGYTGPEIVQFDITNHCNNNCLCCWNNSPLLGRPSLEKIREKGWELPFGLVKKTIRELKEMGTKKLFFAGGGEPFMHPKVMSILEFAKKCDMKVCINTNFTLVTRRMAKAIVDMKIDLVHVSLLAGTPEIYTFVHPNKREDAFWKIKEVLQYLLSERERKNQHAPVPLPHIDLYYVIFNRNYKDIAKMTELAMELKVNTLEFTPVDIIPGKTDSLLLNEIQRKEVFDEVKLQNQRLEEFNRQHGGKVTFIEQYNSFLNRMSTERAALGQYEAKNVLNQPCYAGWTFARILANGDVNPCLKAHRISIGNLFRKSFKDVWNSPQQQEFRKRAFLLDRRDEYFKLIGNNYNLDFGCFSSCDNIQINVETHSKYKDILTEKGIWKS